MTTPELPLAELLEEFVNFNYGELFEDGLSADLGEMGIECTAEAYSLGIQHCEEMIREKAKAAISKLNTRPTPSGTDTRKFLEQLLKSYRAQYTVDRDGYGSRLVDVLSPGASISDGLEEIHLLADYLADGISSRLSAVGGDVAVLREALQWIVDQKSYTFAECTLAEEIMDRAESALANTGHGWQSNVMNPEWMKQKIESEPDDAECEAGIPLLDRKPSPGVEG